MFCVKTSYFWYLQRISSYLLGYSNHFFILSHRFSSYLVVPTSLSPVELDQFNNIQYQYFGNLVENRSFIEYANDKPTRYKPQWFPVSGTFGPVEKVVAWADPSKVFARKRLFHVHEAQMPRVEKEVLFLQKFQ